MRHRYAAVIGVVGLLAVASGGSWFVARSGHATADAGDTAASTPEATTHRSVRPRSTASVYHYATVLLPGAVDSQVNAINAAGAYTGNVVGASGDRTYVDSGRAGASPLFFTVPFAASAARVQTAGIDGADEVVGTYVDAKGVFHGFVRGSSGRLTRFNIAGAGTARGEGTEVEGLSPGGVIVGSFIRSDKVAVGFIDRHGIVTRIAERSAGNKPGDGTAVEFYGSGEYGGIYVGGSGAAHGWYVDKGKLHTVNDPAAGPLRAHHGTQLIGVDARGTLYGIETPDTGATESFSFSGGVFRTLHDPRQARGVKSGTLVLDVSAGGVIVGFYSYDARGQTVGFIGRPAA
jgi:hypothetical protein